MHSIEWNCSVFFLPSIHTIFWKRNLRWEKIQNPRWQKYVSVQMEWFQINGFLALHYVECYVMLCVRFLFTMFKSNCVSIHSANNSNLHRIFRYLFSATTTTWSSYETHNIFSSLTAGVLSFKWMLLFFRHVETIERAMIMFPIRMVSCVEAVIGFLLNSIVWLPLYSYTVSDIDFSELIAFFNIKRSSSTRYGFDRCWNTKSSQSLKACIPHTYVCLLSVRRRPLFLHQILNNE